jgi:hypothetical protein
MLKKNAMYKQANFILTLCAFILLVASCKKDDTSFHYDILAASTSFEDVQAAVDSAENGDIILVPAGSSTWESAVRIPNDTRITLSGSGQDATVISSASDVPGSLINMGNTGSRITNLGFVLSNDNGNGIRAGGNGFRVDHCRFDNTIDQTIEGIIVWGSMPDNSCPTGLVDHCEFNNTRVVVVGDAALMAHTIWAEPLGLGTDNAAFIEDCIFNFTKFGNVIDANYGGRYVFRYNIVNDAYLEAHSVQGNNRSARSWEIYGNTINQAGRDMWTPFFLRGGTGVVFDNALTGEWTSPAITIDNRRSFEDLGDGGLCDGTSPWDGNEEENGYPARDQIGRSTDQWLWTDENPYPPQELDPFYQWNNVHNGETINVYVHNNCGIHIKENRDYYNQTVKPGYAPYTYPHPLISEWDHGD